MRILAFYPGMVPEVNDIAQALIHVTEMGHEITVITTKGSPMKSITDAPAYEEIGNLKIHRLYRGFRQMVLLPQTQLFAVRTIADAVRPDIILASHEYNLALAKRVNERYHRPIVLAVEHAGRLSEGYLPNRYLPYVMRLQGVPTQGLRFWTWLRSNSDAIITYDPEDEDRVTELSSDETTVTYIPWCNQLPSDFVMPSTRERRVIYVGSFSDFKNTPQLGWAISQVLENTPTESAILVGSGDIRVVRKLQSCYGDRVQYRAGCSRAEALQLIASSHFALTTMPLKFGGFIGDAWGTRTPLVTLPNNTVLSHGINALMPRTKDELTQLVNQLYSDDELYKSLQHGGWATYDQHSAKSFAAAFRDIIENIATEPVPA